MGFLLKNSPARPIAAMLFAVMLTTDAAPNSLRHYKGRYYWVFTSCSKYLGALRPCIMTWNRNIIQQHRYCRDCECTFFKFIFRYSSFANTRADKATAVSAVESTTAPVFAHKHSTRSIWRAKNNIRIDFISYNADTGCCSFSSLNVSNLT